MQHIALITTSYMDGESGAEAAGSFVVDFAHQLSIHARVTVVAASVRSSTCSTDQLSVRRFAVPRIPLSVLNPLLPTHWPLILTSLRSGAKALEDLVREDRPNHVLALWVLPGGFWAGRVCRRYGIGFSVWALGSDMWSLGKLPVVRQLLKSVCRRAERRYADGFELAKDVEALCGRPCEFLPSMRRLSPVIGVRHAQKGSYNLAFLGRWHTNKGVDLLLDALELLVDEDWQKISSIRLNGGGPLQEEVHAGAGRLIEQGRPISVGGYLDKQGAVELIEWADYLLLPSRIESIPVIFSDSMQLNTPIIAMPVGDLPRLHALYRFGFIAAQANSVEFSIALKAALDVDVATFDEGLKAARNDFSLEEIASRFLRDVAGGVR